MNAAIIQTELKATLERHGISPRRALRAAATALRSLSLSARPQQTDSRIETLLEMRERIDDLLQEQGLAPLAASGVSWQIIHWLRTNWGGRTLTRHWWGFCATGDTGETLPGVNVTADPVRSHRGRELRAVIWGMLSSNLIPRTCFTATAVTAMIETELAGVYLPKGDELDRLQQDQKLFELFSGMDSLDKIRETLGLSQSRAYERFKAIQRSREKKEQPELF